MKPIRPFLVFAALAAFALVSRADNRKSPHETTSARFGPDRVTVVYGRPYTKSPTTGEMRQIWGGLVPWDKPYRLGADEATLLLTTKPLVFGTTVVQPGAYTLYQIPSESGTSKLVFSSAIGKWGVPVDTKHDVASIDLTKSALAEPVHQLTIAIGKDAATGGGVLRIEWENTEFSAPFTLQK